MDRFSDRIGAMIPGGSFLPSRHPVKVSLVMAALGFLSGWVVGGAALITHWHDASTNIPIFIVSGVSFGVLIFAPALLWEGRGYRIVLAAIVYMAIVSVCEMFVSNMIFSSSIFSSLKRFGSYATIFPIIFAVKCAVSAVFWGIGSLFFMRRPAFFWLISLITLMFLTGWTLGLLLPNNFSGSRFWILYQSTMFFSSWYMVEHILSAICLGMLLWDRTPRPKFAPNDSLPDSLPDT